jgi:hypothetical protein
MECLDGNGAVLIKDSVSTAMNLLQGHGDQQARIRLDLGRLMGMELGIVEKSGTETGNDGREPLPNLIYSILQKLRLNGIYQGHAETEGIGVGLANAG